MNAAQWCSGAFLEEFLRDSLRIGKIEGSVTASPLKDVDIACFVCQTYSPLLDCL